MSRLRVRGDVGGLSTVIWPLLTDRSLTLTDPFMFWFHVAPSYHPPSHPTIFPSWMTLMGQSAGSGGSSSTAVHAFILLEGSQVHSLASASTPSCSVLRRNRIGHRSRSRSRSRKSKPSEPARPQARNLTFHFSLFAFRFSLFTHGTRSRIPSPPPRVLQQSTSPKQATHRQTPSQDKAGVIHVCGTGSRRLSSHVR